MKQFIKNIIWGMTCLVMGILTACSNGNEEIDSLSVRTELSRTAELEANIALEEVGTLDAALVAAVGEENKYKVTKLTLSGEVNVDDIETLHKLAYLEYLDVSEITWSYTEGNNEYSFQANLWGDRFDNCTGNLWDDMGISNYMFAGFIYLKEIKLPKTATSIGYFSLGGCMALESVEIPSSVNSIYNEGLARTGIKELTIPASVINVDADFCRYCIKLRAIYWESEAKVPSCYEQENVLIYVPNADVIVAPSWKNVILDGVAESIELSAKTNWEDDLYAFACTKSFTAKKISYKRWFNLWTSMGSNGGWETIVLPFAPDSIYHESKGEIAPFNSGKTGAKSFWLRSLTSTGFTDVTAIEADIPYIIAMPNNDRYHEETRLSGWVTFVGSNVTIEASSEQPSAVDGPDFSLQPTYEPIEMSNSIYSLNVRDGFGYDQGSIFIRGGGDVRAFEAYAVVGGRSVKSLIDMDCSSDNTRSVTIPNNTGIPQIGDM